MSAMDPSVSPPGSRRTPGSSAITYKMQLQSTTFLVCNKLHFYYATINNMNDVIPALDYSDENGNGSIEALKALKELYSDLLK